MRKSIFKGAVLTITVMLAFVYAGRCDYDDNVAAKEYAEQLECELEYEQWRNYPEVRAELAREDSISLEENYCNY